MSDETQKPDSTCADTPENPEEASKEDRRCAEKAANEQAGKAGVNPPPIDFATFVYSLSTQALALMGEVNLPNQPAMPVDMAGAKQTIDIIGMLEEKTKGNLSERESKLLSNFLYDLRMRYIKVSRNKG